MDAALALEMSGLRERELELRRAERKLDTRIRLVVDMLLEEFRGRVRTHDPRGMQRTYNLISKLYVELSGDMRKYAYTRLLEIQRMIPG